MVFSYDVIEHLPEPEFLLKETYRLLRKNGVLIISTPNRHRLLGFVLIALGLRRFPDVCQGDPAVPYALHWREYTAHELVSFLSQQGFKVLGTRKVFYRLTGRFGLRECCGLPLYHNIIIECMKA